MDINLQMEQFSRAYVHAVAAVAGVNVLQWQIDNDSIDIGFGWRTGRRARLEAQLKCTSKHRPTDSVLKFPLKRKNYDDLRAVCLVPRILIVLTVPRKVTDWLSQSPKQLVLRRCAWWGSLSGLPETQNPTSTTVELALSDVFSPEALHALLGSVDSGVQR